MEEGFPSFHRAVEAERRGILLQPVRRAALPHPPSPPRLKAFAYFGEPSYLELFPAPYVTPHDAKGRTPYTELNTVLAVLKLFIDVLKKLFISLILS